MYKNVFAFCVSLSEQCQARTACQKMVELIGWLEKSENYSFDISEHLFNPLRSVIRGDFFN